MRLPRISVEDFWLVKEVSHSMLAETVAGFLDAHEKTTNSWG